MNRAMPTRTCCYNHGLRPRHHPEQCFALKCIAHNALNALTALHNAARLGSSSGGRESGGSTEETHDRRPGGHTLLVKDILGVLCGFSLSLFCNYILRVGMCTCLSGSPWGSTFPLTPALPCHCRAGVAAKADHAMVQEGGSQDDPDAMTCMCN